MTSPGLVLRPVGELDDDGCADLRRQLASALAEGLQHLVIDLAQVPGLGLAAVQLLRGVDAYLRRREGGLVLLHANDAVRRSLRVNGLDDLLRIRDLPAAALPPVPPPAPQPAADRVAGVLPFVRRDRRPTG